MLDNLRSCPGSRFIADSQDLSSVGTVSVSAGMNVGGRLEEDILLKPQ